ncbi:MAG: EAL domain-containing protein [Chloroflexi bacterium]|nr:EAL domain-containing protein [Chloroflexota bacterium]
MPDDAREPNGLYMTSRALLAAGGLGPRSKLLLALGLVLLLVGGSAGFGLWRLAAATDEYAALVDTTMAASRQADDLNAVFITRHKVLKDAYLFNTDPLRVARTAAEVAGYDEQINAGLADLQANSALTPAEHALIDDAIAALRPYRAGSSDAIGVVLQGGDPFVVQQAAANLTYLKDRPVSAALDELAQTLNTRAHDSSSTVHADVQHTIPIVVGIVAVALLLGLAIGLRAVLSDQDERVRAEAALRHQALHDPLTGLSNRALLLERLAERIASNTPKSAVLLLDLNRFKDVNDTLGHHHGDVLLQFVANRIRGALDPSATVARLGGDEFAVLLSDADAEAAQATADTLLQALDIPLQLADHDVEISASIGIALVPEHGRDPITLLRHADAAMYAAKAAGGGHRVYHADLDRDTSDRLTLIADLRHAIERDELRLHYQPRLDMRTNQVVGVEALVRWQHPTRGLVPPDAFISLAEQTGLIKPLTLWVLRTAVAQIADWRRGGMSLAVAVNLSMRNLQDPGLVGAVAALLDETPLVRGLLEVEVTESAAMSDAKQALETLRCLQAMGLTIAIDDFGTGYSSLAYLKRLPVTQIKIDRGFVRDMATSIDDAAVVRAIIDLGHSLGRRIVAEGVEDERTWDLLVRSGCDEAQGYYMSRPLPAADLMTWLRTSARFDVANAA